MSGEPPPEPQGKDPTMEDILSSIRKILSEDEAVPSPPPDHEPAQEEGPVAEGPATPPPGEDVLLLDTGMLVPETPPAPAPSSLVRTEPADEAVPPTYAVATAAMHEVLRSLAANQSAPVRRGGPSIEDLVREELRPLLKSWLDRHLEPLLTKLVKSEVERVIGRTQR